MSWTRFFVLLLCVANGVFQFAEMHSNRKLKHKSSIYKMITDPSKRVHVMNMHRELSIRYVFNGIIMACTVPAVIACLFLNISNAVFVAVVLVSLDGWADAFINMRRVYKIKKHKKAVKDGF